MVVLIVEDDHSIREVLRYFISQDCHAATITAETVSEAIEKLEKIKPNIILLDYLLLDGTAEPVTEKVRQLYNDDPPKIVLVTAAPHPFLLCEKVGADYLLKKPFDLDELQELIDFICLKNKVKSC